MMNKIILKILISFALAFVVFLIYLGTTDFIVKPKIIESEFKIDIFEKSEINNDFNNKKYISEIGDEKNSNFLNLFNKKKSTDIENLLSIIPTKNSNPVVQDLIFEILTSKKKIDKSLVSSEEDNQIFELYISKLFETGRINEIELYYSQYPDLKKK